MNFDQQRDGAATVLTEVGAVDVTNARNLYERLEQALESRRNVEIDGSTVERADAAGIQVLCAGFDRAKRQGLTLRVVNPSPAFFGAVEVLGLTEHFAFTESAP